MPVTTPPRLVPVNAWSNASSALAKLIVAPPPAGVTRAVILSRMLFSDFGSASFVVEWQLSHGGVSVVVKSCWPAFELPVV